MKTRVTLWIEEDNLVLSFDHPWGDDPESAPDEYDGDADGDGAIGILEYMAQSDDWSGMFYNHGNVTRVKVERIP